jgi:hypothetical protein
MKKFWIIKRGPEGSPGCQKRLTGNDNTIYHKLEEAEDRAQRLTKSERAQFVVLEVVSCFDVADVVRVEIEE